MGPDPLSFLISSRMFIYNEMKSDGDGGDSDGDGDGRVGKSVESALIALAAIFLAHSAYYNNFRRKILFFDAARQKRVLFNFFATKQCLSMLKV